MMQTQSELVFDNIYALFADEFELEHTYIKQAPATPDADEQAFDHMLTVLLQTVARDARKLEVVKNVLQGM